MPKPTKKISRTLTRQQGEMEQRGAESAHQSGGHPSWLRSEEERQLALSRKGKTMAQYLGVPKATRKRNSASMECPIYNCFTPMEKGWKRSVDFQYEVWSCPKCGYGGFTTGNRRPL